MDGYSYFIMGGFWMSTERPQGAADYEADKRNMNWGSYEEDKARGLVD